MVEENKQELMGACFGQEKKINLKQIPTLGATEITPSASKIECCQIGWAVVK